METIFHAGRCV